MGSGEVVIDGAMGEGGGQVLRNAVAFAALLRRRLRIINIRAKRRPAGLRPQHLTAVRAVAELSGGGVDGLSVGSTEISFRPGEMRYGRFSFDAGTAGSTTLMLQSLLPVMCFARGEVEVELRGGTNNPLAPPYEYIERVLLPALRRMGVEAELRLVRRGFYPRGMGIIRARTRPCGRVRPIRITEGGVERIEIFAYSCNLPDHIVRRMAARAEEAMRRGGYQELSVETEALQRGEPRCSVDPGAGILITAHLDNGLALGADALGERGLPAERVAERAAEDLLRQLRTSAPVDKHLGDQLVIWASIADGESVYRVSELTSHATTSIELARIIAGAAFEVDGGEGGPALIRCRGTGLEAP